MWNPEIRQYFEQNLQLVKLLGKYHAPKADVASLTSTRNNGLTGYPWGEDFSTNLGGGYWKWNVRAHLMGFYETDSLTESSFAEGDAARYRVVIDTNTSIMDAKMIAGIEKYVRDGGTFVTFVQTGRHTPTERDAWPISKLTGFRVTHIDALTSEGNPKEMRSMKPVIEAGVFSGDWSRCNANGLTLEAVSEDAKPLMQWTDGSTAVGLRKLGKGYIIQVGCKFRGKQMFDRVGPANVAQPTFEMRDPESKFVTRLLSQILDWQKISKVADRFVPENQNVVQRHYLSNNGLYDVWTLWNQSKSFPAVGDTVQTDWAWDIGRKEKVTLTGTVLPVSLEPLETKSFLTPRHAITTAPLAWFQLQCDWWRATKPVSATPLPLPPHRFSVDLNADWAFKSLGEDEDGAAFASSDVDASKWEKIAMGIWSLPNRKEIKHAIMRKSFTVPKEWGEGDARLSLKSWVGATFIDQGRIWLDGKIISDWRPDGVINVNPDGVLKPGSTHSLAVEIKSKGSLAGSKGQAWLWVWPKPDSTLDLAGEWLSSTDMLRYDQKSVLPGSYKAFGLRRELVIPANLAGKNVLLNVETTGGLTGALVNGTWVRRFHHHIGTRFDLNITPWVKFGQKNEIELVGMGGISAGNVQSVNLGFHDPKAYP